jgi:Amt family ammonium transporter
MPVSFDTGDTAWLLASSALVLFMTPGLAFFYGGMVRAKSVLNILMMSGAAMAIVSVLWVLYGYSLAFTTYNGAIGSRSEFGLKTAINQIDLKAPDGGPGALAVSPPGTVDATGQAVTHYVPTSAFVMFQLMFAIITVALVSGAIADRAKFSTWCVFVVLWATFVYFPVAHWVFYSNNGKGGWLVDQVHAIDFAGGTAVHINSGAAGLACALVIGRRKGWPKEPMRPHNVPFIFLGASMLWFGWFGFNAGSALTAGTGAGVTFTNTNTATAAAMIGWLIIERVRDGHFTTFGAASGAVVGLVAITPSCSSVNPLGAIAVGMLSGGICALACSIKFKLGFDDALDVVGVHMIGGLCGTLLIGLLATDHAPAGVNGLFYGGGLTQLKRQAIGAFSVMGYSFFVTLIIAYLLHLVLGFRISDDQELEGIDYTEHAETAYEFATHGSSTPRVSTGALAFAGTAPPGGIPHGPPHANADGGSRVEL